MRAGKVLIVGAVIIKEGKCFAAQRSEAMSNPLKWEFPGGKVEEGESEADALKRELSEELNLNVEVGALFCDSEIDKARLRVYEAHVIGGALDLREHRNVGWYSADELRALDFTELDLPAVKQVCVRLSA